MSDEIRTIGKNGVLLTEYKGEFGLTACYEGKDGKFWAQWGKPKIGKDAYAEKDRPFKVILGDRPTAISVLKMLLRELGEETPREPVDPPSDDVPF